MRAALAKKFDRGEQVGIDGNGSTLLARADGGIE
jgi:hypothetical protein